MHSLGPGERRQQHDPAANAGAHQNLWASRFGSIYLDCTRAEPPFQMEGVWNGISLTIEWLPNKWFTLRSSSEDRTLVSGFAQVLQFPPTLSYTDENGTFVTRSLRPAANASASAMPTSAISGSVKMADAALS